VLAEGERGICGQREGRNGAVVQRHHGNITALAVDPVEKKPLYHFLPGRKVFSIGSAGCNMVCSYCQNWHISQRDAMGRHMTPKEVVEEAIGSGSAGIAYTYNEPTVWFDYAYQTACLARESGLANVCVTNGYINKEPLQKWIEVMDAFNVDLKSMREMFYREICQASLSPVLAVIESISREKHVEVTTLVIPSLNDSEDEIRSIGRFMSCLSPKIPLHLNRFTPGYRMKGEQTPIGTLEVLRDVAREYLHYVYLGNTGTVPDTRCPTCEGLIYERERGRLGPAGKIKTGRIVCDTCGEEQGMIYEL
jgi:pyruvate formate lyase activating enzyme